MVSHRAIGPLFENCDQFYHNRPSRYRNELFTNFIIFYKNDPAAADKQETSVLRVGAESFLLNKKPFRIFGGSIHYFRVPPEYWRDRLIKLKACGMNTLDTYVAWNLHEEVRGEFNFKGWLNIRKFLKLAQEVGLYVILRPGPYICSEWEYGGLPSWLLSDPEMKIRSMYTPYMKAVNNYLVHLLEELHEMQYRDGGPIIGYQIENEFGIFNEDFRYLDTLKQIYLKNGIVEFLFTSDNKDGLQYGRLPKVFAAINFASPTEGSTMFSMISDYQPNMPIFVAEFWSGWFDHWSKLHHKVATEEYMKNLVYILDKRITSVNLYMFHGGTNFGFMNGANSPDQFTITSYDYDALLNEFGNTTEKFFKTRELIQQYQPFAAISLPKDIPKPFAYGKLRFNSYILLSEMIKIDVPVIKSKTVLPMEFLPINKNGGQGYGFILYKAIIPHGKELTFTDYVRDRAVVMVNGISVAIIDNKLKNSVVTFNTIELKSENELLVLVENLGRFNYFSNSQNSGETCHPRKVCRNRRRGNHQAQLY
ncbi:beta-galactosidase-1-like protein 2 [Tubulanus polymorphus]|uniref:beta-galactosidase-1-like protein 2 n=1 Tax=Tubulanus polymorphus TaxID=672921 RepID=UPI003DA65382